MPHPLRGFNGGPQTAAQRATGTIKPGGVGWHRDRQECPTLIAYFISLPTPNSPHHPPRT